MNISCTFRPPAHEGEASLKTYIITGELPIKEFTWQDVFDSVDQTLTDTLARSVLPIRLRTVGENGRLIVVATCDPDYETESAEVWPKFDTMVEQAAREFFA